MLGGCATKGRGMPLFADTHCSFHISGSLNTISSAYGRLYLAGWVWTNYSSWTKPDLPFVFVWLSWFSHFKWLQKVWIIFIVQNSNFTNSKCIPKVQLCLFGYILLSLVAFEPQWYNDCLEAPQQILWPTKYKVLSSLLREKFTHFRLTSSPHNLA